MVNAYILYEKTSTRQTKKNYRHLDFQIELAHGFIAGFSSRKQRSDTLQYLAPRPAIDESSHESVRMDLTGKTSRRCKWHLMQKCPEEKLCMVASFAVFVQRWLPLGISQSTTEAVNSKHFLGFFIVFYCLFSLPS